MGPPSILYNDISSQRLKRPGRGVDHTHPSRADVKERVELHLYTHLGLRGLFWGEIYLLILHRVCSEDYSRFRCDAVVMDEQLTTIRKTHHADGR